MSVKAIVVDLDRTLLHTDKTLSTYSIEVLKTAKKKVFRLWWHRPDRGAPQSSIVR